MSTAPEPNPSPPKIYGTAKPEEIKQNHIDGFSGDWRIILIVGEGGTGKTRRLRDLEKLLQSPDSNRIVAPLYDFYHIDNFKASSIEQTIIDVLKERGAASDTFKKYDTARQALEAARDDTSVSFLDKQQEVRAAFIKDYNAFAAAQPQHIVLIFDTVEQSVPLTDEAEHELVYPQTDASAGGYYWLINMLPQLQRTITVLGGRSAVLYGKPVPLYDDLSNVVRLDVGELGAEDTEKFAIDQLTSLIKKTEQDLAHAKATGDVLAQETAKESLSILKDIVLQKDELYAISRGIPFWIDVFLTLNQLGIIPKTRLDELYDRVSNKSAPEQLSEQERNTYRQALIEELLSKMGPDSPPLLLALQCMASLRKGVNRKMLVHVAKPYAEKNVPAFDVDSIWDRLQNLLIVKQRKLPAVMVDDDDDDDDKDTTLLFLHDEMYRWFDQHGRAQSEVDVTEAIIAWYDQQLETLEAQRKQQTLDVLEQAPTLDSRTNTEEQPSADYKAMKAQLTTIVRRQEQYRLDQLHYRYQANAGSKAGFSAADLVEPTHTYNLLAYEAILGRDIGTGATLRQETLQNSYRLQRADTLPPFIQAECAARWLLRITYNDVPATADPEATITKARAFTAQLGDAPEDQLARALMDVAETRFWLERDFSGKEPEIRTLLETAEAYAKKPAVEALVSNSSEPKLWQTFLLAEIYDVRGYLDRKIYHLSAAVKNYQKAYMLALSNTDRFQSIQAEILNNLAFALSEQGFVDEAREYAQKALRIRLQFASDHDIALSRNTLARIEIRAGQPALAYQFAVQASETMQNLNSVWGKLLSLPVRAETLRKLAEQFTHAPAQQNKLFDEAIDWLQQAVQLLDEQAQPSVERKREIYQTLGCTYRSRARTRQDRLQAYGQSGAQDPQVLADYQHAREWLEKALEVSRNGQQPDLFVIDILEDLAVTYINNDLYDQRYEEYLQQALDIIDARYKNYVITPGRGFTPLSEATRGYWRELGQIHLQLMIGFFGKYEFGYYTYDQGTEQRVIKTKKNHWTFISSNEPNDNDNAVTHLVLMFGYLQHYDAESPMMKKARYLALRELKHQFTASELKDMSQRAVYLADRIYKLPASTRDAIQRVFNQTLTDLKQESPLTEEGHHQ